MNRRILVVEDQGITGKFCATCLEMPDMNSPAETARRAIVVPFVTGGLVVRACTRGPGWLLDQRA